LNRPHHLPAAGLKSTWLLLLLLLLLLDAGGTLIFLVL
jgi:hypothetical protein